jgi:hypothetical protein
MGDQIWQRPGPGQARITVQVLVIGGRMGDGGARLDRIGR